MKKKCLILLIIIVNFFVGIEVASSFVVGNSSDVSSDKGRITGFAVEELKFSKSIGSFIEKLRNMFKISEVDFTVMTVKETQGSFSIQNYPPVLVSNISDQVWGQKNQLLNAFDLDDYFKDKNGENLTYTVSGNVNIAVLISPDNYVSFSQSPNWFGQEFVTFTATDGKLSETSNIVNLTVNMATYAGRGGGGGGGGGEAVRPKEEVPQFIPDFTVEPNFIRTSIKQGESQKNSIEIKNVGNTVLAVNLDIDHLQRFISLGEKSFSLNPKDSKSINIDISAKDFETPETYIGRIIVDGAGITRVVNVIIEVKARIPLLDIKTETIQKTIKPDEEVTANLKLANFGDLENINVSLYYAIKDIDGNIISFKEENVTLAKELSIVRSLKLPKDYSCVDYVFYAKAKYGSISATSADIFKVECEKIEAAAPPKITIEGRPLTIILFSLILGLLLALIFLAVEYRKIRIFIKSEIKNFKKKKCSDEEGENPEQFCRKCGANLKGKKRYCSKCGTKIN